MRRSIYALTIAIMLALLCTGCQKLTGQGCNLTVDYSGEPHDVKVLFINCGKADSAVIVVDNHAWLVDTGEEEGAGSVYSALAMLEIEELDGIIISHCHDDHVGGLNAILDKYPTKELYSGRVAINDSPVNKAAQKHGVKHTKVGAGDSIPITPDVEFAVIAPTELNTEDDNDNSLVLSLTVNGRVFLFTGDMQRSEEALLIKSNASIAADVLKVGNHGNSDATSKDFAIAVSPRIAVISTDTNVDTDSANKKVMERLGNAEILITQDYDIGVLITVSHRGELEVNFPQRQAAVSVELEFTDVSKDKQTATLTNNGNDADISGFYIYSTRGHEYFVFPKNTIIPAGGSIIIACKGMPGASNSHFVWDEKSVWSKNKDDTAVLFDSYGNELARRAST